MISRRHSEVALAELFRRNVHVSVLAFHELQQIIERIVLAQNVGISDEHEVQTCTSHRHVQLTVNHHSVLFEDVVGEEVQLVRLLYGETIDDIVALAALISLHGVDGDVMENADAVAVDGSAYGGYLVAIRHNYAHRLAFVKSVLTYIIYLHHRGGNHFRLHLIGLHRSSRPWLLRCHKGYAACAEHLLYAVLRMADFGGERLMMERHHFQPVAIEGVVRKLSYVAVHTSLPCEHIHVARVISVVSLEVGEQSFEERQTTVGQSYAAQFVVIYVRFFRCLLHHGWQLLVVADEHEARYGVASTRLCAEQSDKMRLQYL